MEENTIIESIKEKVKSDVSQSRLQSRALKFNSHRKNYDAIAAKVKLPSQATFLEICRSFCKNKKLKSLQNIRYGLSGGGRYITSFLKVDGSLYALVGCFTGPNTKLQTEAGYAIINIGLGSQEECLKVCNKVGAYIIAYLNGGSPQMQTICAWACGNLCGSYEKVCSLFHSQGFEGVIKSAALSQNNDVVLMSYFAINQYLTSFPQRIEEFTNEAFIKHSLSISLLDPKSDKDCDIFWFLFLVSTKPKCCAFLIQFKALQQALDYLNYMLENNVQDVLITTALLRIILNCIGIKKESTNMVFEHAFGLSVIKSLIGSPHEHLRKEAIQVLANIHNSGVLSLEEGFTLRNYMDEALISSSFTP